mmetsp:Transcript_29461/g.84318  ORF Transcript_29461/g.84318 Transcript_29461/m.84318 type:complete len:687 (-) Transcript_29461:36-2096(-)
MRPTPGPAGDSWEGTEGVSGLEGASVLNSDEFRKLLLADVEAVLHEHHVLLLEHLAARQQEFIGQLGGQLGKVSSSTSDRMSAPYQPSHPLAALRAAKNSQATRSQGTDSFAGTVSDQVSRGQASQAGTLSFMSEQAALASALSATEELRIMEEDDQEEEKPRPTTLPFAYIRSFTESIAARKTTARAMGSSRSIRKPELSSTESGRKWRGASSFLRKAISSSKFEAVTSFLILSNAIFIGVEVQYMATKKLQRPPVPFEVASLVYTALFTVELLVRFLAGPVLFVCSPQKAWNMLDTFIVLISLMELGISAKQGANNPGAQQLTYMRIIRMARTVRIFRIMRVLKEFSSLRILVYCVLSTLRSLVWTLLLLASIMYIFGIMFTQAASDYVLQHADETDQLVLRYWSSLWRSAYTLFKAVTGGVSWQDVSTPLGKVHPLMEGVFLIYISFTYFAVLNVVTGVFCQSAIESANHDKDMVVQAQLANKQKYKEQLEELFKSMDPDQTGLVTFNMFEEALSHEEKELQAYLDSMGITPDDAWALFRLMDLDESQDIDMEEFIAACLRLRGNARAVDSHLLMYESRWTMRKVTELQRMMSDLWTLVSGEPARHGSNLSWTSEAGFRVGERFSGMGASVRFQKANGVRRSAVARDTLRKSEWPRSAEHPLRGSERQLPAVEEAEEPDVYDV